MSLQQRIRQAKNCQAKAERSLFLVRANTNKCDRASKFADM